MKTFLDACDGATITLSTLFGLSQIETIVGIIVLSLQGLLLLSKLIYTVVKKIKEKDYKGAIDYTEHIVEEFEILKHIMQFQV